MAEPLRTAALVAVRVLALVVGGGAAAFGLSQVVVAFLSPTVTVPSLQWTLLEAPLDARLVVALALLLAALTVTVVALAVSRLAARVARGPAFLAETTLAVRIAGIALLVGPLLAQWIAHLGRQLVERHHSDATFEFHWFFAFPDLSLPAVGVALLLVAVIVRQGERLQRDTEGLV